MASLGFTETQTRPTEVVDLTSLTLEGFQPLVPLFSAAFQAHTAPWRFDGQPRTGRRYTTYTNGPLPTPEDRLLFFLAYLKTYALQVARGRLFGVAQSKAHQGIHLLVGVLKTTGHALRDTPARSVTELAQRLGVAEAEAATVAVRHPAPASRRSARSGARDPLAEGDLRGSTHDRGIAEATPYPLPASSRLLRDPWFLALALPQVEVIMPTKTPRGRALRRAQKTANRRFASRRVCIEHVNSRVKRCRIVHDQLRLCKQGIRDLVMEVCCGLQNFRVSLSPWQAMAYTG